MRLSVGLGLQMCVLESLKEALQWQHVTSAERLEGTMRVACRAHTLVHYHGNGKAQLDRTKAADDQISSGGHPSKDKELWLCDKCSTIGGLSPVQGSLLRSSQSSKPSLLEA